MAKSDTSKPRSARKRNGATSRNGSLSRRLVAIRRDIHQNPELGYQEERTAKVVTSELRALGLRPRRMAGTGVSADIDSGRPGPRVMLRADMDALPMHEDTGLPFTSRRDGVMHACGHDLHVAILLGTTQLLRQTPPERGSVRLCFQPAEEGLNGASVMIDDGVLDGVDAAFGFHVWQSLPVGRVAALDGPAMAAVDELRITIDGKGAHAAMPHQGVDPIVVAAQVVTALQTIVSRSTNPLETAVVTIGKIEGGTAFNIIPDRVVMTGTVRSFSKSVQKDVRQRMQALVKSVCAGFGARGTLEYVHSNPATINKPHLSRFFRDRAERQIGKRNVVACDPTMGGEDFAFYGEKVPSCYAFLGSAPRRGPVHGHHHPKFNPDEGVLELGARLVDDVARSWLAAANVTR
jgi:amidohydrolase